MRPIRKIILHCTDTPSSMNIGAKEIDQWHRAQGWTEIGYHYVIRRNGQIETGRPIEKIGAHCRGHNRDSIGVCYVGGKGDNGKPEDNRTPEQRRALVQLLRLLKKQFPTATIHGHNEFGPKACPAFNVARYLTEVYI